MFNGFLIVLGLIIMWASFQHPYMKEEFKDVCVIRKYTNLSVYKGRTTDHQYLVMKDSKGRIFDRDVSVSLYTTKEVGDCFKFKLREANIASDSTNDLLFMGIPIILTSLLISCGLTFALFGINPFKNKEKE